MVLGVLAVLLLYLRFGPVAAYLALMAALLVAAVLGPSKLRRLFGLLYCLLLIGLLIALAFQPLASSDLVPSLAERNAALGWLVRTFGTSFRASLQLGLIVAAFCILGFVVASVWISSDLILILSQTSGMGRWAALKCLFLMTLGIWCPWAIVEDGKVTKVRPEGLLETPLGPGIVVIRPGNAVVFEWGGKVTHIEGPGVAKSKRYEIIKKVVDLRPQWHSLKAEEVLTQDRIPLAFKMTVGYQLQPKADADNSGPPQPTTEASKGEITGDYPVYKESVYRSVFRLDPVTPEKAVQATADSFLRDEVRTYNLDDLYDYSMADTIKSRGDAILQIEDRIKARLEQQMHNWGLKLLGADISTVAMPEDMGERVLDWWATAWRSQSLVTQAAGERQAMAERGLGQAEAFEAVERKKQEVRQRITRQLMEIVTTCQRAGVQLDASVAVRLVSVLEAVSMRMTCDSPTAIQYLEALEKLLQSEGDKILIVGESPPMFISGAPRTAAE
jgi:regulator of protease activity HflC (stomatin/prohibitin superfamily)